MIAIFITIAVLITFWVEAKKRDEPPIYWVLISLGVFWTPILVAGRILYPIYLVLVKTTIEDSSGAQLLFTIVSFIIGFYLLVQVRKKLFKIEKIEACKSTTPVITKETEIIENDDGGFSVGEKVFDKKEDAEAYREFLTS